MGKSNARILEIDRMIRRNGWVTLKTLMETYGICERTVKRDIDELRSQLGEENIIYDRVNKRYEYKPGFEGAKYGDASSVLFFVMVKALSSPERGQFFPFITQEIKKAASKSVPRGYEVVADNIVYEHPAHEQFDMSILGMMMDSIKDRRVLEIDYVNSKGESSRRKVEVHRLLNYENRWYIVAWDFRTKELRQFLVARIEKATLTPEPFSSTADYKTVQAYITQSFGIYKGSNPMRAVLRFSGNAFHVNRRTLWHRDQVAREELLPDGSQALILELPAARSQELLSRALSWGAECEILEPAELRAEWQARIAEMYEQFCKK